MNATRTKAQPLTRKQIKARDRDLESFRDISDDVIESDFVPYACLYDADTLATKNGELVQIIRITGLGYDKQSHGDLREAIRQAIRQCIPDASYAVWLHTLRRHKALTSESAFPDNFSREVDARYRAAHPAQASFINELYVSIVKAAQPANLSDMQALSQSLFAKRDREMRTAYLERALGELAGTVNTVVRFLSAYGARRLGTVERHGIYYGEHVEFLEKLINLEERPMEVEQRDLSLVLTSGEITFGHNAMEVRTAEGHRRFASIFTVKEYKESTLAGIDKFLDIPCELIVTQCFDFVGAELARHSYETQARYLNISGDTELAKWVEIDRLMKDSTATEKAYGQQQTSIFLIAPSMKQLEANVRMVQKALTRLGLVIIREDLRFEDCYWAQLPSNFPFLARQHSVDTQHVAGFANLQRAPMGNSQGSNWGPPVALLSTVQDTPYFFNFQRPGTNNLHTLVLGRNGAGRTAMTHFLIAQARKLGANIWYLDTRGRSRELMQAMGGQVVAPGSASLRLNPFQMEANDANREFLSIWLATLPDPYGSGLSPQTLTFFRQLVAQVMTLPQPQRRLSALLPMMREADPILANNFARFAAGGVFGELFDMPADDVKPGPLVSFDLSRWAGDETTLLPLGAYLLHRLTALLDGKPTLLILDEAFTLMKTPLFGPRAGPWCDFLTQRNTAGIFMSGDIDNAARLPAAAAIAARCASIIAMPDEGATPSYAVYGLSDADIATIAYLRDGQALMKRGEEALPLNLHFDALGPELRAILAGEPPPAFERIAS